MYFAYGEKEINYLKKKDKRLGEAIVKIGMLKRPIDTDIPSNYSCYTWATGVKASKRNCLCNNGDCSFRHCS